MLFGPWERVFLHSTGSKKKFPIRNANAHTGSGQATQGRKPQYEVMWLGRRGGPDTELPRYLLPGLSA